MSDIPKNKICWVQGCDKEIKEWPYCEEHVEEPGNLEVPGVGGNNPNIPR